MSNTPLNVVQQHTCLGVCQDHKLSWEPHVNYICSKANHLLGFLKRNSYNGPTQIKEHLYKQLLLPSMGSLPSNTGADPGFSEGGV